MFSFSGNLLAGQHDTQKKRPPPSKPIPVTFPSLEPPSLESPSAPPAWTLGDQPGIATHFLKLRKPSDVNEDTLSLLNVTFQPECDFETFLSSLSNNAQAHLPPTDWLEPPEHIDLLMSAGSDVRLLSNGRRVPDQKEFYVRARELLFANADAFSTLTRKSRGGPVTLRLAHFRKFWEGLDNMAYYWDNTLDEYHPPPSAVMNHIGETDSASSSTPKSGQGRETQGETSTDKVPKLASGLDSSSVEEPRKKAKTEGTSTNSNGFAVGSSEPRSSLISPSRVLPARAAPPRVPWAANLEAHNKPVDLSHGSYRGYRIGNGAEMPDQYRIDCVRAFLEPIAWAFGVTLAQHRRPPVLQIDHVRFPVRMSSAAWRGHQDRMKARQGWVLGPVLGMQCRADVKFGMSGNIKKESILDVVRELGGLLLLAQERARDGKLERRGGEGKWWTTKERWGGGAGGEVGDAQGGGDVPVKEETVQQPDISVQRNPDGSKVRRRPSAAEVWKTLKPGHPLWDPKVVYKAIGKDKNMAWDDVFMISSLNHHISVLRLRVHPLYLEYLTHGVLPTERPLEADWFSPKLQRTRWFDLFDINDRSEAMRGIWGVFSYLMRKEESATQDTTMKEAQT